MQSIFIKNDMLTWEPEFMTIFVIWRLRVTLDSIPNSCNVYIKCWNLGKHSKCDFIDEASKRPLPIKTVIPASPHDIIKIDYLSHHCALHNELAPPIK